MPSRDTFDEEVDFFAARAVRHPVFCELRLAVSITLSFPFKLRQLSVCVIALPNDRATPLQGSSTNRSLRYDSASTTAWAATASPWPNGIESFAGFGLHTHPGNLHTQHIGNASRIDKHVRPQLRRLQASWSSRRLQRECYAHGPAKQRATATANYSRLSTAGRCLESALRCRLRKGAENSIGNRMQQCVSVGMAVAASFEWRCAHPQASAAGLQPAGGCRFRCQCGACMVSVSCQLLVVSGQWSVELGTF